MSSLKETMRRDMETTFFNLNDFADAIQLGNQTVIGIKEDVSLMDRASREQQGLADCDLALYLKDSDACGIEAHMLLTVDGVRYRVQSIRGDMVVVIGLTKVVASHADYSRSAKYR